MHHELPSTIADMNYGEFLFFFAYTFTPILFGGTRHQVILATSCENQMTLKCLGVHNRTEWGLSKSLA